MSENLTRNARAYAVDRQLRMTKSLGAGKDGVVWAARSRIAAASVAIKAHRFPELYAREKVVYQRLEGRAICTVLGFYVPQLLGFDDCLQILEMTIVKRPFILDFAGAHLEVCPEFDTDIWACWETEKREQFEERWPMVEKIRDEFEVLGIYLLDVSPSNIAFLD